MNYGIELEFFVKDQDNNVIPAFQVTKNIDGNPVVGEIKTGIHDNITDCIFELKKLLYIETEAIRAKGYNLVLEDKIVVSNQFKIDLRKNKKFVDRKELTVLEEFSVYPNGKVGKVLPSNVYKASLQINFSDNDKFTYTVYDKVTIDKKYKYDSKIKNKVYSSLFNFQEPIFKLDTKFSTDISSTGRVKGVYAIKKGELGSRVEYRSLPNTVDLDQLLETINK